MIVNHALSCGLALCLGAVTALAAPPKVIQLPVPQGTNSGGGRILVGPDYGPPLAPFKAQNRLSAATNQVLTKEKSSAGGTFASPGIQNGKIDTIPYFNSWFVTGSRNSVYTYSMVGHSPKSAGTTPVNNMLIPLQVALFDANNNMVAFFDPAQGFCATGSDMSLTEDSPIYNIATYPGGAGLPADTGQFTATLMRAEFNGIRVANWHTQLNKPLSVCTDLGANNHVWSIGLPPSDWTYLVDQNNNVVGEAVDINVISQVFGEVLTGENINFNDLPNNTIPVILTDSVAAYDPAAKTCCVLGFHTAQAGIQDPNGVLVWAWATFLPPGNIFSPSSDVSVLSHEMSELFNNPFVNNSVAPWVDGSATFAQGNLEVGDVIEAMQPADALYQVTLNTASNGTVTYTVQNEALLDWFTRTPLGAGAYSWPNTHTLGQCPHVLSPVQAYCYGEGSAGFFQGPPY